MHAAQWGTLNRLIRAVLDPAGPGIGWALDEDTTLQVIDGRPAAVHGAVGRQPWSGRPVTAQSWCARLLPATHSEALRIAPIDRACASLKHLL